MLQTKEKRKSEQIFSVILTVLLLAFLGLVFYVNLSCNPEYYDGDIYADIEYAKQAWKAKSLFPQNWVFGNQTYVVATPALAAIIYGIINNAVLAMGIASCIMTVLLVLTYDWMLKSIYSYNERTAGFLSMAGLILIKDHIATGVRGAQLFFTMASYYSCYVITAFVVFGCYIRIRQRRFSAKHVAMAVIGVALSFGTGMQSLRQTAVMALPLVACEVLLIIIYSVRDKKFTISSSALYSGIVFVSNIAGLVAMKHIEINQNSIYGTTALVKSFKEFFEKFYYNIEYVVLTFGLDALKLRVRLAVSTVFLLIVLIGFILCVKDYFKNKCVEQGRFVLVMLLTLGCVSVFAAGIFTDVVNRALYYFMIYPLLAVCVSYILVKCERQRTFIFSFIAVFTAGMLVFRAVGTVEEIKAGKDEKSTAHQIASYMLGNGYDTVYSVFGLSGIMDGAENIIVASGDKLNLVQYKRVDRSKPMKPVEYLCVKDGYKRTDNEKSLYLLREWELPKVEKLAEKYGVTMTRKAQFGEGLYLYSMSENICIYTAMQK